MADGLERPARVIRQTGRPGWVWDAYRFLTPSEHVASGGWLCLNWGGRRLGWRG